MSLRNNVDVTHTSSQRMDQLFRKTHHSWSPSQTITRPETENKQTECEANDTVSLSSLLAIHIKLSYTISINANGRRSPQLPSRMKH